MRAVGLDGVEQHVVADAAEQLAVCLGAQGVHGRHRLAVGRCACVLRAGRLWFVAAPRGRKGGKKKA